MEDSRMMVKVGADWIAACFVRSVRVERWRPPIESIPDWAGLRVEITGRPHIEAWRVAVMTDYGTTHRGCADSADDDVNFRDARYHADRIAQDINRALMTPKG